MTFLECNDRKTLKVKANDLHFQYQLRGYQDAYLVQNWFNKLLRGQAKFP